MPTVASIIFDLLMVGLVVAAVFIGKKMGLLRMVFILSIVFIASLIARFSMPLVNSALTSLKVGESVKTSVSDTINGWIDEDANISFDGVVEKMGLPKEIAGAAEKAIEGIKDETGAQLADKISTYVADATVKLASYIIVALIVIIILVVISLLTKLVQKIPVVGAVNSVGGIIVGVLAALVIVFLICIFASSLGLAATSGILADIAHKSFIIKFLSSMGVINGIIQ